MDDLARDYCALRQGVGAVRLDRDVVIASGPDTMSFLQGQLSQNVEPLAVGESAWSFLLQPQGKVDAWLRVTRTGDDEVVLDTDAGYGQAVLSRLERFKLRTRCDLVAADWECVAVRGPDSVDVDVTVDVKALRPVDWPGVAGFDLLAEHVAIPPGVDWCGPEAYEAVRIEAGVPRMGAELTDRTIPAEAGEWLVAASVSFTKGCFTGQELVARIDSRGGNVPRHLRGVVVSDGPAPRPGAELRTADGSVVGALTSVAERGAEGTPVALAYVGRGTEPPAEVTVAWKGDEVPARVESLPLVR